VVILYMLISYLFGSVPWALVIGKVFYHTDVREHGSHNLGGSNAGRVLGKRAGISVIVLDALKAFFVVWGISLFDPIIAAYSGLACVLGHCFPIFAKFKGGKGVATTFGYLLGVSIFLTPHFVLLFVIPLAVFIILLVLFKMVSLAAMVSLALAAVLSFLQGDIHVQICLCAMVLLVILRHHGNISRILGGTERKITWLDRKKKE